MSLGPSFCLFTAPAWASPSLELNTSRAGLLVALRFGLCADAIVGREGPSRSSSDEEYSPPRDVALASRWDFLARRRLAAVLFCGPTLFCRPPFACRLLVDEAESVADDRFVASFGRLAGASISSSSELLGLVSGSGPPSAVGPGEASSPRARR